MVFVMMSNRGVTRCAGHDEGDDTVGAPSGAPSRLQSVNCTTADGGAAELQHAALQAVVSRPVGVISDI